MAFKYAHKLETRAYKFFGGVIGNGKYMDFKSDTELFARHFNRNQYWL